MMTAPTPAPIPAALELNIPGGTYTATPTFVIVDKAGQWFCTSMSGAAVPTGQFGIHVWYRKTITAPWELLRFADKSHGSIQVLRGMLYFICNRPNGTITADRIERFQGL